MGEEGGRKKERTEGQGGRGRRGRREGRGEGKVVKKDVMENFVCKSANFFSLPI
jgi:hypothetical protein